MPPIAYTAIVSVVFVVALLTWRIWPVARGRAKLGDSPQRRLEKWNIYLSKLVRKTIDGQVGVAHAGFVTHRSASPKGDTVQVPGVTKSIATWPLLPTLIPDVDFIALARPDETPPKIQAVADAALLREMLADSVRDHSMWGHQAWLYTWPVDFDLDALVEHLIPIETFKAQYGRPEAVDDPVDDASV
ncbi:MAG: hypothetical protein ACI9U2_002114 [Bradymonadia bacterium]|jgi:hypothetical protein